MIYPKYSAFSAIFLVHLHGILIVIFLTDLMTYHIGNYFFSPGIKFPKLVCSSWNIFPRIKNTFYAIYHLTVFRTNHFNASNWSYFVWVAIFNSILKLQLKNARKTYAKFETVFTNKHVSFTIARNLFLTAWFVSKLFVIIVPQRHNSFSQVWYTWV